MGKNLVDSDKVYTSVVRQGYMSDFAHCARYNIIKWKNMTLLKFHIIKCKWEHTFLYYY